MMVDCLNLLTDGSFWTGIVCPFTNIFGDWFYLFMLFTIELIIMVKFDNITAPATFGAFTGVLMIGLMPNAITLVPYLILIVNIAAVLYAVYFRGEG